MSRAVLVLGPESSGTRLLTRGFIAAGFFGDGGHEQRVETEGVPKGRDIVWRKSYPHGDAWPDIVPLVEELRGKGFEVHAVVIVRSAFPCVRSQRHRGHSDSSGAPEHLRKGLSLIFEQVTRALLASWTVVTYEEIVLRGKKALRKVLDSIEPIPNPDGFEKVKDENAKYYRPGGP